MFSKLKFFHLSINMIYNIIHFHNKYLSIFILNLSFHLELLLILNIIYNF